MNTAAWVLLGAAMGWAGFTSLKMNLHRGLVISLLVGGIGGYFGGHIISPMFANAASAAEGFSPFALMVAAAAAAVCLFVSDSIYERFGW